MKLQFTTKSMLLATAFAGVSIGGFVWWRNYNRSYWSWVLEQGILESFMPALVFWGPGLLTAVFAAYAIGQRRLTWQSVLTFLIATLIWAFSVSHR